MRRSEDVNNGASLDQWRRLLGRTAVLQKSETAGPPSAFEVEIRAVRQQYVQQSQVFRRSCNWSAVEMADRIVHGCSHFRVRFKQLPYTLRVAIVERDEKALHRGLRERVDLPLH